MDTSLDTLPKVLVQAWRSDNGPALMRATEELLGAGLYTAPCLAQIAGEFSPLEGSALRMDALNTASVWRGLGATMRLFAIPIIGTPQAAAAFAADAQARANLASGYCADGLVLPGTRLVILAGCWESEGLLDLAPQALRDALGAVAAMIDQGRDPGQAPLACLSSLAKPTGGGGNKGAALLAVAIEPAQSCASGASALTFLLEEGRVDAVVSPLAQVADDPVSAWRQSWRNHGPAGSLSALLPTPIGGAAAATIELDSITAALEAGARTDGVLESALRPQADGGAVLEMRQDGEVFVSRSLPAALMATVGASLLDRIDIPPEEEPAVVMAPAVPNPYALMLVNLCRPRYLH